MAEDLAALLDDARARGFAHDFAIDSHRIRCAATDEIFAPEDVSITDIVRFDAGTDPGDEATVYLMTATSGTKGFLILADAFHADPDKRAFLDRLSRA